MSSRTMVKWCICKCFLYSNIYIKQYNVHLTYKSDTQFLQDHGKTLQERGCEDPLSLIPEIKAEIQRRKLIYEESAHRITQIKTKYKKLHESVYTLQEDFLAPSFIDLVNKTKEPDVTPATIIKHMSVHKDKVYTFPVFTQRFCKLFLEELSNFSLTDLPKGRPNSMNNYGILLGELGFDDNFLSPLREQYLDPLSKVLFPEWVGEGLDSHHGFTVAYKIGQDLDLDYHYDNSEVTLNVALTPDDNYDAGELYFGSMKSTIDSGRRDGYKHNYTTGFLHRGQHLHGALPIAEGERTNLILWLRSSTIRNHHCPLCSSTPDLQPVTNGGGGGFTTKQ